MDENGQPIVDYYLGSRTDQLGRKLEDVLAKGQNTHDYIQWKARSNSPVAGKNKELPDSPWLPRRCLPPFPPQSPFFRSARSRFHFNMHTNPKKQLSN